jgi:hypothetical protein
MTKTSANVIDLAAHRARLAPKAQPPEYPMEWWHVPVSRWCLDQTRTGPMAFVISPREWEFLISMEHWQDLPTERQKLWLESIEAKIEAALEAGGDPHHAA